MDSAPNVSETSTSDVCKADASTSDACEAQDVDLPQATHDHDYILLPPSDAEKLEHAQMEIERLNMKLEDLEGKRFLLERFATDPSLISFYTGLKDYSTLKAVYQALQPTAENMVRWTQIQRHSGNKANVNLNHSFHDESLPLIDQFFMFLCRVRQ